MLNTDQEDFEKSQKINECVLWDIKAHNSIMIKTMRYLVRTRREQNEIKKQVPAYTII